MFKNLIGIGLMFGLIAYILGGCGQKGPLYLPTPEQEQKEQR
jgi:predicted small lipoprotein YifL